MFSTVGIIKHYHQDYPIHSLRTDFAGKNGVGKSVIADLLQLIFIQDRSVIKFATEGLKKELRRIETLPYKHRQGYAYLTIEVARKKFIAIGVSIPTDTSTSLVPFILTSKADINRAALEEVSYPEDKILKSEHFLSGSTVLPISDLTIHLRNNYGLYLKPFKTRSQIFEYHLILNRFKLFPINLSVSNNLKAFARVIQSFSRAKDFDPTDSKKLKDYLFDEDGEGHYSALDQYKAELATQLANYKDLSISTDELSRKRSQLKYLKELEINKAESHIIFQRSSISHVEAELESQSKILSNTFQEIEERTSEKSSTNDQIDRLKNILMPLADQLLEIAQKQQVLYASCSILSEKYKKLQEDQEVLNSIDVPELSSFKSDANIEPEEVSITELIRRTKIILPILNDYTSLKIIVEKALSQEKLISELTADNERTLAYTRSILEIVRNNKSHTLFNKVLEEGKPLSQEQESALFHLIKIRWEKPSNLQIGAKYTSNLDILDKKAFTDENSVPNSFWYTTGFISELLPLRESTPLLNSHEAISAARSTLESQLQLDLQELDDQKIELDKIRNRRNYDRSKINYDIDLRLTDTRAIEEIIKNIKLLETIKPTITHINSQKNSIISEFKKIIGTNVNLDELLNIPIQVQRCENSIIIRKNRLNYLTRCLNLKNTKVTSLEFIIGQAQEKYLALQKEHNNKLEDLSSAKENLAYLCRSLPITETRLEHLCLEPPLSLDLARDKFDNASNQYNDSYFNLTRPYIQDGTPTYNAELAEQVRSKTYMFRVLEENLLRGIGLLEDVEGHLTILNKQRLDCRLAIYSQVKNLFSKTINVFNLYRDSVRDLNAFFKTKKISNTFTFKIDFEAETLSDGSHMIDWVSKLHTEANLVFQTSELQLGIPIDIFIENFYKQISKETKLRPVRELLNPKSYFNLATRLVDDQGFEAPGSTGEAYTSIVLLGIGRISVISERRAGIKFIILEEIASVDDENFDLVMRIAYEFGYQILTMTPKPYGIGYAHEWYLHHLIKGKEDKNINYPTPASYIRSKAKRDYLQI